MFRFRVIQSFIILYIFEQHTYDEVTDDLKEFYNGCAENKFCLGSSSKCEVSQNCDYFVGISKNSDELTARFQLARKDTGYVAVGLSHDDKMVCFP